MTSLFSDPVEPAAVPVHGPGPSLAPFLAPDLPASEDGYDQELWDITQEASAVGERPPM